MKVNKLILNTVAFCSICILGVTCGSASAQLPKDRIFGFWGLGALSIPEYDGANDADIVPLVIGRIQRNQYYLEVQGLTTRVNVSRVQGIEFGPMFGFRFARDEDLDNETIAMFEEIDSTIEAGAFINFLFQGIFSDSDQVSFSLDILTDTSDAHDGTIAELNSTYSYMSGERLRVSASLILEYGNDEFTDTYFSVSEQNSIVSGLPRYEAEEGFNRLSATLFANYMLNQQWSVMGLAGYQRLLGDAADSPIVDIEGDENQMLFGAGIAYHF